MAKHTYRKGAAKRPSVARDPMAKKRSQVKKIFRDASKKYLGGESEVNGLRFVKPTRSTGNNPRTLPSLRRSVSDGGFAVPSSSGTVSVSNFAPAAVRASQGRMDHEE